MSEEEVENSRSFQTKSGTCSITDEDIVLVRTGIRGAIGNILFGHSIMRIRIILGGASIYFLATALYPLLATNKKPDVLLFLFLLLLAFVFFRALLRTRGLSVNPILKRSAITEITCFPPVSGFRRGAFIVHFKENGEPVHRYIIMPGLAQNGAAIWARANEIMKAENLITESEDISKAVD